MNKTAEYLKRKRENARAWRARNPERAKELLKNSRAKNREKYVEMTRVWRSRHPERVKELSRRWEKQNRERANACRAAGKRRLRKENPEKYRAIDREKQTKRREQVEYRVRQNLCRRITRAIHGRGISKSAKTVELLGMGLAEFKIYIQGQFRPGMAWENYGPVWHVDHVRPCASFDLTDPEQQRICFHWTNLQPLFAEENLKKGAKYGP